MRCGVFLLFMAQAAQAEPLKWTALGDLPSLGPGGYISELNAAAQVWTIETEMCGTVNLLEWTDDVEEADVLIETVDDLGENVFGRYVDCDEPDTLCLVQILQSDRWATPADAVANACYPQLHFRAALAHSMGRTLGATTFGEGEPSVWEDWISVMYFSPWCREEVELTERDIEVLDLDWSEPFIVGVRDGGILRVEHGNEVELVVDGPEIQAVEWRVNGTPSGSGASILLDPFQGSAQIEAEVTYTHSVCDLQEKTVSITLEAEADWPSTILPPESTAEGGCSSTGGPDSKLFPLIALCMLVLGARVVRRD